MLQRANGFFGHIRNNHVKSIIMFAGFAVSMQIAFAALLALPLTFSDNFASVFADPKKYFLQLGWLVFLLSMFLFLASYFLHTAMTRLTTGFNYIQGFQDKRLENIVKNMAWTAGIPVPEIGIIETPALNSFACGLNADNATLVVTRGLMNELDDDELQGVIAHEIVHIMNGDIGMMAAANASHSIIKLVNWLNPFQIRNGGLFEARGSGCAMFFLFPIIIPLIIILAMVGFAISLSSMVAGVTRYFVTSSREYIADAEAIRLTHNPAALISALTKIEGRSLIPHLDRMSNAMMIDGPADGELASHPPILDRIQALLQYGGSMVHGAGQRMDTRSFGQRVNPTHYDPAMARTAYRRRTDKGVIARVTADKDSNIFGMPEGLIGRVLGIGFGIILLTQISAIGMSSSMSKYQVKPRESGMTPIVKMTPAFIVVDLDKRGLRVRPFYKNVTHVDFDKDGRREAVSWPESNVGFLFVDRNNNGRMDFPRELLRTDYADSQNQTGMSILAEFDTDRNGQINRYDAGYQKLKVWRNNGSVFKNEDYETSTLERVGILSIHVMASHGRYQERYKLPEGAQIVRTRPYDLEENEGVYRGKNEALVYEVAFETDITHYRDDKNKLHNITQAERERYGAQTRRDPSAIKPSIGPVGDMLDIRPIDEEQKIASSTTEKTPQLRGRRSD